MCYGQPLKSRQKIIRQIAIYKEVSLSTRAIIAEIERDTDRLMQKHRISPTTGFLAECPWVSLLWVADDSRFTDYLLKVHLMAGSLPELTKRGLVVKNVAKMIVPTWPLEMLPREGQVHLMLDLSMIEHAFFRELLGYQTVQQLFHDTSEKYLPPQLAVPLWQLSKITGINPTCSYDLYGLHNWRVIDPTLPVSLDNVDVIHSFTGEPDEHWFVRIHHIVQITEAPAIRPLIRAYLAVKYGDSILLPYVTRCLKQTAGPLMQRIAMLKRMNEHCDPTNYFNKVRMFYAFPRNVVFQGVDELEDKGQNFDGETGGGRPDQQLSDNIKQVPHRESTKVYQSARRNQMLSEWRDLLVITQDSKVRDFILDHRENEEAVTAFNVSEFADIDWGIEHNNLVSSHIRAFGEERGTANPILNFLWNIVEDRRNALIY